MIRLSVQCVRGASLPEKVVKDKEGKGLEVEEGQSRQWGCDLELGGPQEP